MIRENERVNFSSEYEKNLNDAVEMAVKSIRNKYICLIPDEWDIRISDKKIPFSAIKDKMQEIGLSKVKSEMYYGLDSSIIVDVKIVELTINDGGNVKSYPLFIGEDKKQGTNDKRIFEGKSRQAIGNAVERAAKNYIIVADYCFLYDRNFFPYVIFAHGCDFGDDMTKTMKAKLMPYIGEINKINPYFDSEIWWARKGGTCFCQNDMFTTENMYKICYEVCKIGIEHYLKRFGRHLNTASLEEEMCESSVAVR